MDTIIVPHAATLVDCFDATLAGATAELPREPRLWGELLAAVTVDPMAQAPPFFTVEDAASGEAVKVNQAFARRLIESYERGQTDTITVTTHAAMRTFRAGPHFRAALSKAAAAGELPSSRSAPLVVSSHSDPGAAVVTSLAAWHRFVHRWNLERAPPPEEHLRPPELALQPCAAVSTPSGTDQVTTAVHTMLKSNGREGGPGPQYGPRYYTAFMNHWRLLEGQYRNYL